jgi:hypothetical protein
MIHEIVVRYPGEGNILTESPVMDIRKIDVPQQNPLNPNQVGIQMATFFLVFSSLKMKKLAWVKMEDCEIVTIREAGTKKTWVINS